MQSGRCCRCSHRVIRSTTIKGINIADGTTEWEYGPGHYWRHHYGVDAITGIAGDSGATLDRYVTAADAGGLTVDCGNRNAATLTANAAEALSLTKLSSIDGSVTSDVVIDGLFVRAITGQSFTALNGTLITAAALSGGNYVIVGELSPSIEFVGFASNGTNKTYILHAHGQKAGNIVFKTRTSDETITLAYNATAANVKTAFEATADCVTATCTGGPWPLSTIQVDAVWSVAGGDVKSIYRDLTYAVTFTDRPTECCAYTYTPSTGLLANTAGYVFGLGMDLTAVRLLSGHGTLPSPAIDCISRLGNAIGSGASDTVVVNPLTSGGSNKSLEAWTVGSTWTNVWQKYINSGAGSGPSGHYISGYIQVENDTCGMHFGRKTFNSPTRTRCGATVAISTGTVTEYDNSFVSTTTTENEHWVNLRLCEGDAASLIWMDYERKFADAEYPNLHFDYHLWASMVDVDGDVLHLEFGQLPYGADSTQVYGSAARPTPLFKYDPPLLSPTAFYGFSSAKGYLWTFYVPTYQHVTTGTEFRFRFAGVNATFPTLYSNWIDWHATEAQINTAIIAGIGENTEGGLSSATLWAGLSAPVPEPINTVSWLEVGLQILFGGAASTASVAYTTYAYRLGPAYFTAGKITIETRTVTHRPSENGIAAWTRSTGALAWVRKFGVLLAGAPDVAYPHTAWLRGSYLYVTSSSLLEDELP